MESSVFSKKGILGLLFLVAIGLFSLVIIFIRIPSNKATINGNIVKSSAFDLSFYDNVGNTLFTVSPLDDFFYTNTVKDHLEDKIIGNNNGNFLQNIWSSLKSLIFNQKDLIWNTSGSKNSVSYVVEQINGEVKIQRAVGSGLAITSIGQVIKFCADCLVADDKNRVYFNADTIQQFDIDTAKRLNLIPVVVGENQFLSSDMTTFRIIDRNNNLKMEIPVGKAQVFLQYKWRLLEFKTKLNKNETSVSQEILLHE